MHTEQEYLTTAEAAQRLKVSAETVRAWTRSGKLAGVQIGRRAGFRIAASSVERLLAGQPVFECGTPFVNPPWPPTEEGRDA